MNICEATKNGNALCLGKQGEYGKTFEFDYSDWIERFGEGSIGWMIRRSQDEDGYLVPHIEENGISTFVLTEADTQYVGRVEIEVFYVNNGQTQKRISQTFIAMVYPSMQNLEDVPEPWQPYVDAVHADAVAAQEAKESIENMTATASVDDEYGTPAVTVTKTTEDDHENLDFAFANLRGNGITGIELYSTSGLINTYRITMNSGESFDFDVEDGNGIVSAVLNNDYTLTLTFTNGDSYTTPSIKGDKGDTGNGIKSIAKTGTSGLVDTYTITFDDNSTETFTVKNGNGITNITSNPDYTITITTNEGSYTTTSMRGAKGDTGATPNLTVGTVSTLLPSQDATVTITGTAEDPVLNFGIPKGETGDVSSVNGRTGAVTGLAEEDGYYEEMSVGGAEQLLSNMYETDAVPYKFRTSGGSLEIGDREYDEIVGGSLVVNQLMQALPAGTVTNNGVTFTSNGDGSYTVDGTATANAVRVLKSSFNNDLMLNHVYYYGLSDVSKDVGVSDAYSSNTFPRTYTRNIWRHETNKRINVALCVSNGTQVTSEKVTPEFIDLTAEFGSTIADYILTLETATTGAGVAWVQKYIGSGYHPYSANTLTHVSGLSKHEMTGFNQWDEQWEVGKIDYSTGTNASSTANIRGKNYIDAVPNTTYFWRCPNNCSIFFYDADKNFLSYINRNANLTFSTPDNTRYMRFFAGTAYGTTYANDICINFHWDGEKDGEYEPYEKHTYALDSSLTLRGVPKQDESGNLYFDGDRYRSDGTVDRRFAEVDLGSLTWASGFNGFYTSGIQGVVKVPSDWASSNIICSKYPTNTESLMSNDTIGVYPSTSDSYKGYLIVRPTATYADATEFKNSLSGVMLTYEVATPTEESAEPYVSPQWVNNWGTEEYVSETIVPVGHQTNYLPDLRAKLETMADSPNGDGVYALKQTSGINEYIPLVIPNELPTAPSEDGNFSLKCTVSGGVATLTWEQA